MLNVFGPMRRAALAAVACFTSVAASGNASDPSVTTPTLITSEVRTLKRAYLECDRASTTRLLALADAATCSQVHERLLKIGFDGDFNSLLAWWRAEKAARDLASTGQP
jgi:hypothetical protein